MTDEQLMAAVSHARGESHRAPFAEHSQDLTGHSRIVNHTSAFAIRGHEFFSLMVELRRRGLEIPACDCPAGAHDWELKSKGPRPVEKEIAIA